jgi:radical SAM superfamily enzyme YgiQ (UPF0313 family)
MSIGSMKKLLLIQPPSPFLLIEKWLIPNQLFYLREFLVSQGVGGIDILNLSGVKNFLKKIPLNYEYYGISFFTPQFKIASDISAYIKENSKGVIIGGGHHVTALPEESLEKSSLDVVVRGEGEQSLLQIITGQKLSQIDGITYRNDNGAIKNNPERKLIQNIDNLPFPNYDSVNFEEYPGMKTNGNHSKFQMSLMTSRGCPYSCAFCASRKFWRQKARFNSSGYVIAALDYLRSLGINQFRFDDDNFDLKLSRLERICADLRKHKSVWTCMMRSENVTKEKIQLMKHSGCSWIALGVETGSNKLLRFINKSETVENHKQACKIISKAGINVLAYLMVGLPGETQETVNKTVDFIKTQPVDKYTTSMFVPFPGTEIWENPDAYHFKFDPDPYYENFTLLSKEKMTPSVSKNYEKIAKFHKQVMDACKDKNTIHHSFDLANRLKPTLNKP